MYAGVGRYVKSEKANLHKCEPTDGKYVILGTEFFLPFLFVVVVVVVLQLYYVSPSTMNIFHPLL